MPKQNANDLKQGKQQAAKINQASQVPHARGGGQTDSATGDKPGGGGNLPKTKK